VPIHDRWSKQATSRDARRNRSRAAADFPMQQRRSQRKRCATSNRWRASSLANIADHLRSRTSPIIFARHPERSEGPLRSERRSDHLIRALDPPAAGDVFAAIAAMSYAHAHPGAASRSRAAGKIVHVAGVRLTHADRVLFPDAGLTKEDLARFYASIASFIVPQIADRPLTLVRCPGGVAQDCSYMRHGRAWGPSALRRVAIQEKTKIGEYLVADDLQGVIALVQMDILEIHTWNSRFESLERPDRFVVDLDPGPDVPWATTVEAARFVRARLAARDLDSFVKTTGGKGLHVVVPNEPNLDWARSFEIVRKLVASIASEQRDLFTTSMAKSERGGRIYLDYLRNNRANTSVAAYSTRAKPHAPVSTPLRWDELDARTHPDSFTALTIPARLAKMRDPWRDYARTRQRLA